MSAGDSDVEEARDSDTGADCANCDADDSKGDEDNGHLAAAYLEATYLGDVLCAWQPLLEERLERR